MEFPCHCTYVGYICVHHCMCAESKVCTMKWKLLRIYVLFMLLVRTEKDLNNEDSLPPLNWTRMGGSSRTFSFIHPDILGSSYHKTDLATSKKKSIFDGVYPATNPCPTLAALLALSIDRIIAQSDTKSTAAAVLQKLNQSVCSSRRS